jgi:hypothetical protein
MPQTLAARGSFVDGFVHPFERGQALEWSSPPMAFGFLARDAEAMDHRVPTTGGGDRRDCASQLLTRRTVQCAVAGALMGIGLALMLAGALAGVGWALLISGAALGSHVFRDPRTPRTTARSSHTLRRNDLRRQEA